MTAVRLSLASDSGLAEAVGALPGVEVVTWDLDGPPPTPEIDIVVPPYWGGVARLARVAETRARLLQWQSIGFDGVAEVVPTSVAVANAATVHEDSTAEVAMALALAAQRGIPEFVRAGDRGHWELVQFPSFVDRRVLIVGYGGVGKALDARLQGFGVQVTRLATSARVDRGPSGDPVPVRGIDDLHDALADAEIVFLAVPLTPRTRHLIDAAALAAMPDGALLVNVARGAVVDTAALVAELAAGRLRAALDVVDPEPLPPDHPLWRGPNVLISPHVGGDSSAMLPRISALIHRQLGHLQRGEPFENVVLPAGRDR